MPRPRLFLVDGSAQVHRAYFAVRSLTTSRGLPTGATYGFTSMLRKLLEDETPEWIGMSFDLPGPTFRHQQYPEYKANRPRMEDDLVVQMPYVRRVCEAFRVPVLECAGFEADDVIATLTRQARQQGLEVVVVSGDKDLLQLVGEGVFVLNPGREGATAALYDAKGVEEKFGVPPERVVDVLALMGDATDNVPGVAGIGEKGARELVRTYGPLEVVLANAEHVKRAAYREGLRAHRQDALLSKELVTLRTDAPVTLDLEALRRQAPDRAAAYALFGELEFQTLARAFAPEPAVATRSTQLRLLGGPADLDRLADQARRTGRLAMAVVTTTAEAMRAEIRGLALAAQPGDAGYLPLAHSRLELPDPPDPEAALATLRPLLADVQVAKLSAQGKHQEVVLGRRGVPVQGLALEALLAAFLVNPGRRSYSLEDLAGEYLGERLAEADAGGLGAAGLEQAARAACLQADLLLRLEAPLLQRLADEGLAEVYRGMELPLVGVLAEMEQAGVKLDVALLGRMSGEMEQRIAGLTREIHELAGGEFNLNSPAQLREVLFDHLGLRQGKKTAKTRAASTAEDVLEELAASHPLPGRILEYRMLQKLKSTYVDALPALVHPETGRVHSTFSQTAAATGRLSSSDPNLQNIPIRTAEGRRIREAFVAEPGHLLLSADYSQIELRILAHLSGDATLIDGFRRGEDVHERTAREVFGPFSALPPDERRRRAKMVNYALLYGKTAFSLARDLGVARKDADRFIEDYFSRYPKVRLFFDETLARARETGFVRTLLGRLRRLPDLHARNFQVRMEAERQARNTPVQGSAADLIKKAMIDLHRELAARRMASRLVLQIHDELLLEVPEAEAEAAKDLVRSVMEGALELVVPLVADTRLAGNWAEAH